LLNLFIVAFVYALDGNLLIKNEMVQVIQYENIQNVKPVNHGALIEDLKNRTGLDIHKIEIESIDFLKDTARIKVYYYEK
jgi:hypothetical protein